MYDFCFVCKVFDMGSVRTCQDNFVEIIEPDATIQPLQFCGVDNPSAYKSKSSTLSIRFKKTAEFSGTGWIINFMGVHQNSVLAAY